jgi:hypothetical protein
MPPTIVTCPSLAVSASVTRPGTNMTSMMRAVVVVSAILAASISSASSEDFTCDQWLLARATDPSQDNKALKPLIAFIQGYIAALNQVSDGFNAILKLPVRPTEVGDVLSGVDDGCRRNGKASGPASIEMRLKVDTAAHLLPVMQAIQELRH